MPAAKENAHPFKGQGPHSRVMTFVTVVAVAVIKRLGPGAEVEGAGGILMKALAQEFGASPTEMDPVLGDPAALNHGSNPGVGLELVGGGEAVALGAERRQKPWGQCRASTREGLKNGASVCVAKVCSISCFRFTMPWFKATTTSTSARTKTSAPGRDLPPVTAPAWTSVGAGQQPSDSLG